MRLIDADTLKEHKYHSNEDGTPVEKISAWKQGWNDAIDAIANYASTVDAELVGHGTWIKKSDAEGTYYICSECGYELPRVDSFDPQFDLFPRLKPIDKTAYCPNCGCKMDEVENETC